MTKCPICEKGILEEKKVREKIHGVYLGSFPEEVCNKCGESFTDSKTTTAIIKIAQRKNVWHYWGKND